MATPPPASSASEGFVLERFAQVAPRGVAVSSRQVTPLDVFGAVNVTLFALMCVFAYYERWLAFVGSGRAAVVEFLFYASTLIVIIVAMWVALRRLPFPAWLLGLIQVGLLAHFAGGLVQIHGSRLYDHSFGGMRFDKWVHIANACIVARTVEEVCRMKRMHPGGFLRLLSAIAALGLGSLVEVSEFIVTRTIPGNGVGGYDDNMRDLIANLAGVGLFLVMGAALSRVHGPAGEREP